MARPSVFPRFLVVVVLGSMVVSCTGREEAGPHHPLQVPAGRGERGVTLPLDPYFLAPADTARLHRALDLLVAGCMRRAGLEPPPDRPKAPPASPRNQRRYGVTSEEAAGTLGYHPPDVPSAPAPHLTADQTTALSGTGTGRPGPGGSPPQGCTVAAARQITGTNSYPMDPELVRQLNYDSYERTLTEPPVRRAMQQWSNCMKGRDHRYATPLEPTFTDPRPTAEEKRTALADVACKRQTDLINIWSTTETAVQKDLIAKRRSALDAVLGDRDRMLARADAVQGALQSS